MWGALRELMAGLSPRGRFWMAVAVVAALVVALIVLVYAGLDTGPLFKLLGGGG